MNQQIGPCRRQRRYEHDNCGCQYQPATKYELHHYALQPNSNPHMMSFGDTPCKGPRPAGREQQELILTRDGGAARKCPMWSCGRSSNCDFSRLSRAADSMLRFDQIE